MKKLLWFGLLMFATQAPAQLPLGQQPIHIEADQVNLDEQKGQSVYTGNVQVKQGDMEMRAERLTVEVEKGKVHKLLAKGAPVHFRRDISPPTRAKATHMEYYANEGRVLIYGKAHVWQGLNEFAGERIEYDMNANIITAAKGDKADDRVKVILHPQQTNPPSIPAPSSDQPARSPAVDPSTPPAAGGQSTTPPANPSPADKP